MRHNTFADFQKIEDDLWEAADQLRANSKLSSSEYCMPVLGVIFLRQASNRFDAATREIEKAKAAGEIPDLPNLPAEYVRRRSLYLPEAAHYDVIVNDTAGGDLGARLNEAMRLIEESFPPLLGVLPNQYGIFEKKVLEDLLRIFNSDALKKGEGDLFGRIYEYFLMKFAIQGAQDNGEFFTPPSLVQTIVNIIEPDHGIVLDPACGSGGMFVQSSHFIENQGKDAAKRVTFYGQEKTATTIKLAKMNLAVHGLDGHINEANTFYQDEHSLVGKADFVMANPPFNVDMVDASRARQDTNRLPFGLPGVNAKGSVSNGNYLWISYFWSYLKPTGRAGFVMSSQASSAGHTEKDVRQKIVETGDVDALIAIRSNFFYTRAVPCELWFFDRAKPEERRDTVLMLDARNVYRKVTRKIYDFSPEQLANLSAIVWLYRGQSDRFLGLMSDYLDSVNAESVAIAPCIAAFDALSSELTDAVQRLCAEPMPADATPEQCAEIAPTASLSVAAFEELKSAAAIYAPDAASLADDLKIFTAKFPVALPDAPPLDNAALHHAAAAFDPLAAKIRGLIKQIDLLYKLTARSADAAAAYVAACQAFGIAVPPAVYDRRAEQRRIRELDEIRKSAVEQLKSAVYFHRQMLWLQERFPDAVLCDVPGLVRVVSRADIAAADWSLTPGRYVGVAPAETDDDFDFEETLRGLHVELSDLNREASDLAAKIQTNFEELGI